MKKVIWLILLTVILTFAIWLMQNRDGEQEVYSWGSFTNQPVVSSDGKYRAEHHAVQHGENSQMIQVDVFDRQTGELIYSFVPARAIDFWGICWEAGSHNIWIQSADIGVYCYERNGNEWKRNDAAIRPETIKTKWNAE